MSAKDEIKNIKNLMKERDKALKLQRKEYARRLEGLNHEAAQLKEMQHTYLPREVYDLHHRELEDKVEELVEWKNNIQGRILVIVVIGGAVWTFILALLFKWIK